MATQGIAEAELQRTVDVLAETGGNVSESARILQMSRSGIQDRRRQAERRGIVAKVPFKERTKPKPEPAPVVEKTPEQRDEIGLLKARLANSSAEIARLYKRIDALSEVRDSIFGLVSPPPRPVLMKGRDVRDKGGRTILLMLSDIHAGEVVDLAEMMGINSFDKTICARRVTRFFETSAKLATKYWHGDPPERIVLLLGGDMIAGEIHEELAKTNDLSVTESIRHIAALVAGGIEHLRRELPTTRIDVYTVEGNHGRPTRKPESKGSARSSFDLQVSYTAELIVRDPEVRWSYADGADCLFDIYGRPCVLTHGHKIGSRGGQGFIGAPATIMRGVLRIFDDYAGRGVSLYRVYLGHFHTTTRMPGVHSNGSAVGPSQYGQDGRMKREPPQQLYQVHHAKKGIIETREILLGDPEEGTICA